ncbi:CPXCG motif-containing cysteine-rich protein [Microbulbifer sp. OS29]|uniref:CPXCG motif-containing cysteine-rich protein n=1 Tax=Microbulbifer okhotskensis TaxID=2926617 RepID=A0A9X2EP70_9GAMM|nr:CPXCG motif-containing cysteine-rich protein [Microbulbifer okhotskensis]
MPEIIAERSIYCPYCGETIKILIDLSVLPQQYTEDCQVCCRPIVFSVELDLNDELSITAHTEDEAL